VLSPVSPAITLTCSAELLRRRPSAMSQLLRMPEAACTSRPLIASRRRYSLNAWVSRR
jgi:hypothetical protein